MCPGFVPVAEIALCHPHTRVLCGRYEPCFVGEETAAEFTPKVTLCVSGGPHALWL